MLKPLRAFPVLAAAPILALLSCFHEDVAGPTDSSKFATAAAALAQKIAFNSWDGGRASIYVVNPNGTGLTKLTPDGQDERRPLWSPDRSKIAFVRSITELWVMSSVGRNRVRLTNRLADGLGDFQWSPDGSMIVFERNDRLVECEVDGEPDSCPLREIWTLRSNGSNLRKVTNGEDPSWAPNGARIAFHANRQIYLVNANGTGRRRLTDRPLGAFEPAWSPAGRIAFVSRREQEVPEIFVIRPDGTGLRNLTAGRGEDSGPVWSRDGNRIAFTTTIGGSTNHDVAVMAADGGGRRILTRNTASDVLPTWSPDGSRLAFMRKAFGEPSALDVYIINSNGTGERNLTNNPSKTDDWPSWSSE